MPINITIDHTSTASSITTAASSTTTTPDRVESIEAHNHNPSTSDPVFLVNATISQDLTASKEEIDYAGFEPLRVRERSSGESDSQDVPQNTPILTAIAPQPQQQQQDLEQPPRRERFVPWNIAMKKSREARKEARVEERADQQRPQWG